LGHFGAYGTTMYNSAYCNVASSPGFHGMRRGACVAGRALSGLSRTPWPHIRRQRPTGCLISHTGFLESLNGESGVVCPLTSSAESQVVVFISYRTKSPKRRKFRGSLISCLGGVGVDDSMPQRDQIFCRPNESASGFLKVH